LTSDRCYRPRFTPEEAVRVMQSVRGTQLDAELVALFLTRASKRGQQPTPTAVAAAPVAHAV